MTGTLSEREQTLVDALPAASMRELADEVDIALSTTHARKERINDTDGHEIVKVNGEWVHRKPDAATVDGTDDSQAANSDDTDDDPPPVVDRSGEPTTDDLPDRFISALQRNGLTYQDMADRFGWSRERAKTVLDRMSQAGWAIDFRTLDAQGTRQYYIAETRDKRFQVGSGDGTYRFGLISDTHLGSKATHLEDLHEFYDILHDRGVDTVFHAGDITDGWEVHQNQVNELEAEAIGWQRLREYTVEHYPKRPGMDTLFISGNHDRKLWRRQGVRLGKQLDNRRDDLHWLGDSMARLVFGTGPDAVDLELIHPSGGQPYTLGYRAQTLYREQPTDMRPDIAAIGHLHGRLQAASEGVEAFYAGCWKDLTTYGKRKGHAAEIGGFDVELTIADGRVDEIATSFLSYETNSEHGRGSAPSINDVINDGRTVQIAAENGTMDSILGD